MACRIFQIRPMGICLESQSSRVHWVRRFFAVSPILGRSVTLVGPSARCQQRQNLAFTQRSARSLHPSRWKERDIFSPVFFFFSWFFIFSFFSSFFIHFFIF